MRHPTFGSTGMQIPLIGLGTWLVEQETRARAIAALQAGIDAGAAHIDTAEMYGNGAVEELVGEAIRGRRDEVFLVTKILPENASREGTIRACERSLTRLGTDRIDCYLLHWAGPHPMQETFDAFERLARDGKIRSWGVSNFDEMKLQEAIGVAGEGRIACNQVLYHLNERAIEHAVIPFCLERNIAVVAYSPFGSGSFPDSSEVLRSIAGRLHATPRQIALAFLLRSGSLFAIPKSSDPGRARENAAAADLVLDPEDVAAIDAAFPRGPRRWGVPTL